MHFSIYKKLKYGLPHFVTDFFVSFVQQFFDFIRGLVIRSNNIHTCFWNFMVRFSAGLVLENSGLFLS